MKRAFCYLIVFLLGGWLTACGFQPLYGTHGDTVQDFQDIEIAVIPERNGQILRNNLIDRLYKGHYPNKPKYQLLISPIKKQSIGLGLDRETTADTRVQLTLLTQMRLIDTETKEVLLERPLRGFVAYNVLESQFTTIITRRDAEQRGLEQIADRIITELALYFKR